MVKEPRGIISLVIFDTDDSWNSVFDLCSGYVTQYAQNRLAGIAISAVVVEKQYIDKDYRNTFSRFHSKKFVTPEARCIRLHLFTTPIEIDNPRTDLWQESYVGYIILRPTLPNSIGRSLLAPRIFGVTGSYLCLCKENVMVNGVSLNISGFPFISQDTDATVCAQSSLWMLLRFFSNRYKWYREVYPSDLTSMVRSHPQGRSMPGAGLTMLQMADVLRDLGFSPLLYHRQEYGADLIKYAYNYLESGIPLLLGLPDHVIVGIGHLCDLQRIGSTCSYDYFKGFVVNDDNGLPYALLTDNKTDNPFGHCLDEIDSFLAPLPDKVFLSVEQFGMLVGRLLDYLAAHGGKIPSLRRLFITTGKSFKKRALQRFAGLPEVRTLYLKNPLPHFVWVCELSEPDLYSRSGECLGEIIWDATRNAYDGHWGLALHLPGMLVFDNGAANNSREDYQKIENVGNNAYPIYRNNLEEIK